MFYFIFLQNIDPELITLDTDSDEDIDNDSGNGDGSSSNLDDMEEDDREDMEVPPNVSILKFISVQ